MIWILKEELAELVQHLTDAQAEINGLLRRTYYSSSRYHQPREEAIRLARKIWFNDSKLPLVTGGPPNSNFHLTLKALQDDDENAN